MSPGLLALFVVVGLGNYLMRCVPFLISLRRPGKEDASPGASPDGSGASDLLAFVGPCVVVALLVTSLLPQENEPLFGTRTALDAAALVPTVLVAWRTRNLGLTVLVGVVAYWLVSAALPGAP